MVTLLTVDGRGSLFRGQTIALGKPDYSKLPSRIVIDPAILSERFPTGISMHGQRYLLNWSMATQAYKIVNGENMPLIFGNPAVEAIFELIRSHDFPSCTSRFQSLFGCETLDHLEKFATRYRSRDSVYQIKADKYKLVDMAWLAAAETVCQAFDNGRRYWSGDASGDPLWECLIELPVTVGEKVGQI